VYPMTQGALLEEPGPAQFDWLVHFCGRPSRTGQSGDVAPEIAAMTPHERLLRILWDGEIRGFPAFGTVDPVVCLSECTKEHMEWLIGRRGWAPWGILLRRQDVYDLGGGPVWYSRTEQYAALPEHLKTWAVRLETAPRRSDWLHEREWRLPSARISIPTQSDENGWRVGILVGDPTWQPFSRGDLPELWGSSYQGYWDGTKSEIVSLKR
jgi:hypothetical protein